MTIDVILGARIECETYKGTVQWIGEIPGTQGEWIGIDWDDENRGKHNGVHQGVQFFKTKGEKSGSFVRPSKVSFGISLEEAVRGRYQDDYEIEEVLTSQLRRNIKASFVEVVGMEKVGKKQSTLESLKTIALDGWPVKDGGTSDLGSLFPRLHHLDISNSLLSDWSDLAHITKQLPNLRNLNISSNRMKMHKNPQELISSMKHITHLGMNRMLHYSWNNLVMCCQAFPQLEKIQLAFNNLSSLGPVPPGVFEELEELDLGANPIQDWQEICHLGKLPKLSVMNLNNCELQSIEFNDTLPGGRSRLFQNLRSLIVKKNPLDLWDTIGELDKLLILDDLIVSNESIEGPNNFFIEYAFARIRNLMTLNRTCINLREKRDHQLFYLRSFSNEYYDSGGCENPDDAILTPKFVKKHPTYLYLVRLCGAPLDERSHRCEKSQKLRDLKILLHLVPSNREYSECTKSFLPTTRISKVKMMIKRIYNLNNGLRISLFHQHAKNGENFEIELDNDLKEIQFYSLEAGDTVEIRW